jgi:hypothetical protein
MSSHWFSGELVLEVVDVLNSISKDIDLRTFENEVYRIFSELGYAIERQFIVLDRGDGRRGKIDFLLESNGKKIALIIDKDSPRKKSIFKLENMKGIDFKFIYCKNEY